MRRQIVHVGNNGIIATDFIEEIDTERDEVALINDVCRAIDNERRYFYPSPTWMNDIAAVEMGEVPKKYKHVGNGVYVWNPANLSNDDLFLGACEANNLLLKRVLLTAMHYEKQAVTDIHIELTDRNEDENDFIP